MKVLKFGGTSVGTIESLRNVKSIVESYEEPVVVVVSALGGLTDKLIATAKQAEGGSESFVAELEGMRSRHKDIINELVSEGYRESLIGEVDDLFGQLYNVYKGISLLEELSPRSLDKVVSFGERLSSRIIAKIIEGAEFYDSTQFIKTLDRYGRHVLDNDVTDKLIHETFDGKDFKVAVVPGFISKDSRGVLTNLGRGGSDYTAAIIAATLDADVLEIWTDVDGFMTADPRIISGTRVIPQLSFTEAMELCNFGAKVIYPPTIYPVFHKSIPIYIKNTFNPSAPGTRIHDDRKPEDSGTSIKGVSSIGDSCLLTVTGNGSGSNAELSGRTLNTLARNGISVLLVAHESNSTGTTLSIAGCDIDMAKQALEKEFSAELETGELHPLKIERNLSTIAVVADDMRNCPETAAVIMKAVSDGKVDILARSQNAPETSVSFVVEAAHRQKALQIAHDCFFGN